MKNILLLNCTKNGKPLRDLDRSITFYTGKLGFELEFRYEDFYAGIIKDGCSIHLKTGMPSVGERKNKRENSDLDT